MTKEQLCEYRELQKEIKRLQARIEKLKDKNEGYVADVVKGSSIEFPYTQHPILIEGFDAEKKQASISRFKELLSKRVEKSMNRSIEIAEFICNIESVKIRTIFEYRYYDLMTWQQIAYKIGVTDESYPRRIHDKFFEDSPN
ncbi:DUF1492 domain-containing protein [Proteiniclasticum ruminis]|uniref:Uncharacterized protein n=1 Tax=Proteiniclasticum ruminis TaxID=398199 RepID=A0A1I4ZLC8_9CLOT|nr:DUF1492 domain-containing protein [Proteiniclasticum ruminis]SFN51018.1 hypothetical protein SAMN04488695_10243 [Proteiniclasticum ruminis]